MSTRAVIYSRISKDLAGDHLGVERQQKLCRKLAAGRGLEVVGVLEDNDLSAFNRKVRRPAFERMVEMLKAGEVEAVVAYHADRLYRRVGDLERLVTIVEATGAQIHTVAAGDVDLSTATGRMTARVVGAMAQHESERTGERMKMKNEELAAAGKAPGGRTPFGYRREAVVVDGRVERRYVVDAGQAEAVRTMARRLLEGGSLLAIARELTAAGVTTREGKVSWPATTVRATVTNPAVAGLRVHRGEVVGAGDWEQILDRTTWEQVCAVIQDPSRKRTRPVRKHLLSGFVFDEAGRPMMGVTLSRAGGRRQSVYRTHWATADQKAPAGQMASIVAEDLERLVGKAILVLSDRTSLLPAAVEVAGSGEDVAGIEAEVEELAAMRGAGEISFAEWRAARTPLVARLEAAKQVTVEAARHRRRSSRMERLLATPGALRKAWEKGEADGGLSFDDRREVIAIAIQRVVVKRSGPGRWRAIEDRVVVDWRV